MNWNQLQYVITIAEEKSITKAAQKLYISQPSLSLSIQAPFSMNGQFLPSTLIPSWNGSLVISFPAPGH